MGVAHPKSGCRLHLTSHCHRHLTSHCHRHLVIYLGYYDTVVIASRANLLTAMVHDQRLGPLGSRAVLLTSAERPCFSWKGPALTYLSGGLRRVLALLLVASVSLGSAGCATIFMDQAPAPGSDQLLVVGHDGMPFKAVWVIDGKSRKRVKVVRSGR